MGFWNSRLGFEPDPNSAGLIAWLQQVVDHVRSDGADPYVGGGTGATRRYEVPADQPGVMTVVGRGVGPANGMVEGIHGLPIPDGAKPATSGGNDHNMVIVQPSINRCFEFWRAQQQPDGTWTCGALGASSPYSAVVDRGSYGVHDFDPYTTSKWSNGISGSGMPIEPGQIKVAEAEAGYIGHPLALCLPDVRKDEWAAPAIRSDGTLGAEALPYGARLSFTDDWRNLLPSDATTGEQMVWEAVGECGYVVRERTHSVVSVTAEGSDAATVVNVLGKDVLHRFPWNKLAVVTMDLHSKTNPTWPKGT